MQRWVRSIAMRLKNAMRGIYIVDFKDFVSLRFGIQQKKGGWTNTAAWHWHS